MSSEKSSLYAEQPSAANPKLIKEYKFKIYSGAQSSCNFFLSLYVS